MLLLSLAALAALLLVRFELKQVEGHLLFVGILIEVPHLLGLDNRPVHGRQQVAEAGFGGVVGGRYLRQVAAGPFFQVEIQLHVVLGRPNAVGQRQRAYRACQ